MKSIVVASVFAFALFLIPSAKAESPIACPEIWAPVCGAQQVQCVRAPCYPQYKTYSNSCFLNADKGTFIHEGECSASETGPYMAGGTDGGSDGTYVPPEGCMAWFDGCNSCSRASANGPAMCTLMACTGDPQPGYCRSYEVPKPPVDGDTPVTSPPGGSGSSVGSPGEQPIPVDIDGGIGDTPERGFFTRVWLSITSWFSSLF